MKKYNFDASIVMTVAYAAAMEVVVEDTRNLVTVAMTGNGTITLGADSTPSPGDEVIFKVSSDGIARDLTFGTGFTAPVLAGVINKTKTISFVYDGTAFIATGAAIQID